MKKFLAVIGIVFVSALGLMLGLNALGFRPLDFEKNDPNSNAMLMALVFFLGAAGLFGSTRTGGSGSMYQNERYAKHGMPEDQKALDLRFPYAIASAVMGAIFLILYIVLNRFIIG